MFEAPVEERSRLAGEFGIGPLAGITWLSGFPPSAIRFAGTDFIVARKGRIAAVYLFFHKLP